MAPLTQKDDRDVKKVAVKLLKLKKKIVRDLITEWKEKEVIGTVRVDKGKKRLQGLGLTENGRKLLENYANGGDAKRLKLTPKGGVFDAKGGRRRHPHTPQQMPRWGEARHLLKNLTLN